MKEYDITVTFGCGELIILSSREIFGKLGQLVIVGRKQRLSGMFR